MKFHLIKKKKKVKTLKIQISIHLHNINLRFLYILFQKLLFFLIDFIIPK